MVAIVVVGLAVAVTQSNAQSPPPARGSVSKPAAKAGQQPESKLTLLDATRVSTDDAIKDLQPAGKTAAKPNGKQPPAKGANSASKLESLPASDVVELQSAGRAVGGADPLRVHQKGGNKSFLKNVHGDVFGATDSGALGGNQMDGAVGGTSKSGKTSVYVQTDHAHNNWSH